MMWTMHYGYQPEENYFPIPTSLRTKHRNWFLMVSRQFYNVCLRLFEKCQTLSSGIFNYIYIYICIVVYADAHGDIHAYDLWAKT